MGNTGIISHARAQTGGTDKTGSTATDINATIGFPLSKTASPLPFPPRGNPCRFVCVANSSFKKSPRSWRTCANSALFASNNPPRAVVGFVGFFGFPRPMATGLRSVEQETPTIHTDYELHDCHTWFRTIPHAGLSYNHYMLPILCAQDRPGEVFFVSGSLSPSPIAVAP